MPIIGKHSGRNVMKMRYAVTLSLVTGIAVGAVAVQGLYAQGSKTAYSVSEVKIINRDAERAYTTLARGAIRGNQGKALRTIGGRIEKIEGAEPPTNVAIVE
jgi:hypothetical protein